jgi:hypothetical protein
MAGEIDPRLSFVGRVAAAERQEEVLVVALDAGPSKISYTLNNGAALRTTPDEIAAHEHLVDSLVSDVIDNSLEGRHIAMNIGDDGYTGHGPED